MSKNVSPFISLMWMCPPLELTLIALLLPFPYLAQLPQQILHPQEIFSGWRENNKRTSKTIIHHLESIYN